MKTSMMVTDKLFALKSTPPFDRLRDAELALIAGVARARRYAPGEIVCSQGEPPRRLYVVVEGTVQNPHGEAMPAVFGAGALLFHLPVPETLSAAPPDGATCLLINKAPFHTTINECPGLLAGFRERE